MKKVTVIVNTPALKLQSKTVTPTKQTQTATPDAGYDGLSKAIVNPIPAKYKEEKTYTKLHMYTWSGDPIWGVILYAKKNASSDHFVELSFEASADANFPQPITLYDFVNEYEIIANGPDVNLSFRINADESSDTINVRVEDLS